MTERRAPGMTKMMPSRRWRLRHAALALLLAACGGSLGKRTAGGESHFLDTCTSSCGGGLECISQVCTRSCQLEGSDCSDLAPSAACTDRSLESGRAVCEVACERDRDCSALGVQFGCSAGFCRRAPAEPPQEQPQPGGAGAPGVVPFAPECSPRVGFDSECSFDATCAELHCGDGFSQFGADGCTRYCEADADCATGQRCRHTVLASIEDSCPSIGSEVEGCTLSDGRCSCSISSNCAYPSICVDVDAYPATEDCVVDGPTCRELVFARENIAAVAQRDSGSERRDRAAECLIRLDRKRLELGCVAEPFDAFAPACAQPVAFESECGFASTCEQLGCGDGLSQFDANGCTRYCQTSADCATGQRCRHTRLVLSEEDCPSPGSEVEACSATVDGCECSITDDCPHPDICVDAAEYPESLDCAVDGASCGALANGEFLLRDFVDGNETGAAVDEARSCLDSIRAKQTELGCGE